MKKIVFYFALLFSAAFAQAQESLAITTKALDMYGNYFLLQTYGKSSAQHTFEAQQAFWRKHPCQLNQNSKTTQHKTRPVGSNTTNLVCNAIVLAPNGSETGDFSNSESSLQNITCDGAVNPVVSVYNDYVLYELTVGTLGDLTIYIENVSASLDPSVFLYTNCTNSSSYVPGGCVDAGSGGAGSGLGRSEEGTFALTPCSTVFIKVQHWRSSATGSCASSSVCTFTIRNDVGTVCAAGCDLAADIIDTQNATAGNDDGSATVEATGASGNYTYMWDNGEIAATANTLSAGEHTVLVSDANDSNCTVEISVTIEEDDPCDNSNLAVSIDITNTICTAALGAATANVSGASGTVAYRWSSSSNNVPTINALIANTYTVTITDGMGCEVTADGEVIAINPANISLICPNPQICAGGSTLISTTSSGNWTNIQWSNGKQTPQIIVTTSATYEVTATDSNGCIASSSFAITQYAPTNIAITGITEVCAGTSTTLTVIGGNAIWSNGTTTPAVTVTPNSTTNYTVQVTDANGCTANTNQTVIVNPLPVITLPSPAYICTQKDSVLLTATTINPAPTYIWTNGSTQASTYAFTIGTYSVTVTDGKGCVSAATVEVQEGAKITGTMNYTNTGGTYNFNVTTNTPPITLIESIIEDFNNGGQVGLYIGDVFAHTFTASGNYRVATQIKGICNDEVIEAFIETNGARLSANFGMKYGSINNEIYLIGLVETSDNDIIALFKQGNSAVIARLNRQNGKVMCADKYEYEAEPISITSVGIDAYALILRANKKEYLIRINAKTNRIASMAYKNMPTKIMAYSAANSKWVGVYKDAITQQDVIIKTSPSGLIDTNYPKVITSTTSGNLVVQKIIPNGTGFIILTKNGGNPQIKATDADFNALWKRDISAPSMTFTQAVLLNGYLFVAGNSDLGLFFTKINLATQQIVQSKLLDNNGANLVNMQLNSIGNIVITTSKTAIIINENFEISSAYTLLIPQNTVINNTFVTTQNRLVFGGNTTENGVQKTYIANSDLSLIDACLLQLTTIRFTPYTITLDNFYGIQLTTISKPSNEILYPGRVITNLETDMVCGQVTNTQQVTNASTITLFPNPATHTVNLRATNDIHEITITNILGQKMLYQKDNLGTTATINTTDFSSGTYFVTTKTTNATNIQKLLIQK